jgi:hypothetical protein
MSNDINTSGLYNIEAIMSRLASLILNERYNLKLNRVRKMLPAITIIILNCPESPKTCGSKLNGIKTAEYKIICVADSLLRPLEEGSNWYPAFL